MDGKVEREGQHKEDKAFKETEKKTKLETVKKH